MNNESLHMLLLTADPALISTFVDLSKEFHIKTESTGDYHDVSDRLTQDKYEGIILDFDTVAGARPLIARVRESRSNKNAIVFAVATSPRHMQEALEERAHFLLRRPIDSGSMRQTLNSAYDLMQKERRRYFRLSAQLPVVLARIKSNTILQCSTTNISNDGMALNCPAALGLAETVDIAVTLPDEFVVRATGLVIWDDKHGKTGLHFHCTTSDMRIKLDSWLDLEFASQRTE